MDVAVTKIFKKSKFVTDPVTDPHRDTCNKPAGRVSKILGGGDSWYYVFCGCGRQLGAAHEDDKEGMAHLRKIASNE